MKFNHTPGPWRIGQNVFDVFADTSETVDKSPLRIADCCASFLSLDTCQANAARIVKCVNLHDELTWHLAETIELLEMQLKHDLKLSDGARAAIEGRVRVKKDLFALAKEIK